MTNVPILFHNHFEIALSTWEFISSVAPVSTLHNWERIEGGLKFQRGRNVVATSRVRRAVGRYRGRDSEVAVAAQPQNDINASQAFGKRWSLSLSSCKLLWSHVHVCSHRATMLSHFQATGNVRVLAWQDDGCLSEECHGMDIKTCRDPPSHMISSLPRPRHTAADPAPNN